MVSAAVTCAAVAGALWMWPSRPRGLPFPRAQRGGGRTRASGRPGPRLGRWRRLGGGSATASARGSRRVRPGASPLVSALAAAGVAAWFVSWPAGAAAGLLTATAFRLVRRARAAARDRADMAGTVGALRAVIRELHAGMSPPDAVTRVARGAAPAVAGLLDALPHAVPGAPPPDVVHTSASMAAAHRRLLTGWELSARHGIPLAAILAALADDLGRQIDATQAVAVQTAGPAVSGYVLAGLPLAGLALGGGMGAHPLAVLTGTPAGGALLVVGAALCCAGLLWADRIVRGSGHA